MGLVFVEEWEEVVDGVDKVVDLVWGSLMVEGVYRVVVKVVYGMSNIVDF